MKKLIATFIAVARAREDGSETGCFQIAGRKILDACIALLKRKGKIEGFR